MPSTTRPLRAEWTFLHRHEHGFRRYRLYPDRLESVTYTLRGREVATIPVAEIERADLVVRHKKTTSRLQVRLKNGRKVIVRVHAPVLWKKAINELVGAPWDRPHHHHRH